MRFIDLTGQRFGELAVIERGETRKRVTYWTCRCDCGGTLDVSYGGLVKGRQTTCGHVAPELAEGRRPWPRDPRYMVGADGSIVGPSGYLLTPWIDPKGYPRVSVYPHGEAPSVPGVHIVVCETYHGPRPAGMEVAHLNGDAGDPRAENLEWKTHADNEADKLAHGTRPRGERVYCAKLTEQDVRAIRSAAAAGASLSTLEAHYPVHLSTISSVVLRKTWAHVP